MKNKTLIFTIIVFAVMLAACGGAAASTSQTGAEKAIETQIGVEPTSEPQAEEEVAVNTQEKGDPERGREIYETGGDL